MINTRWTNPTRKGDIHTTITSSTTETSIIPGYAHFDGVAIRADLYGLIIANTSASDCNITIRDGVSATIRDVIAVKAGTTVPWMVHPDLARQQTNGNNDWTATCSTGVASIEITALYLKNS